MATILLVAIAQAQRRYDLLRKHAHAIGDIAVAQGKISAISENIPASEARKTIDVSSLYLTPGLVDIHTHGFAGGMSSEDWNNAK
jgi:dihydroorotase